MPSLNLTLCTISVVLKLLAFFESVSSCLLLKHLRVEAAGSEFKTCLCYITRLYLKGGVEVLGKKRGQQEQRRGLLEENGEI